MVPRLQVDQETSCNTSKDWSAISKDKYFEPTYHSYEKRQARGICQHAISAVGKNPLVCFSGSYILILQVWFGLASAADLHQHAGHHNSLNFLNSLADLILQLILNICIFCITLSLDLEIVFGVAFDTLFLASLSDFCYNNKALV